MLPSYYRFTRARVTSNASRYRFFFSYLFPLQKRFAQLSTRKKSFGGRGFQHTIIRTRGRLLNRLRTPSIAYAPHFGGLGFIGDIQLFSHPYRFLSLIILTSGITFYAVTSDKHQWFSVFSSGFRQRIGDFRSSSWYGPLIAFPKLSLINSVEVDPEKGAQLIRSMGAKCIYYLIDLEKRTAVLKLPSKNLKTVAIDNHVSLGLVCRTHLKYYPNTKAGFYVKHGLKPTVRGVAKNPVDHPHGGRTKSIKNPLTPWGFTTKGK